MIVYIYNGCGNHTGLSILSLFCKYGALAPFFIIKITDEYSTKKGLLQN